MRKKILCKVKQCEPDGEEMYDSDHMIIYTNGTWRWSSESAKDDLKCWMLGHCAISAMFLYKDLHDDSFRTDWSEDDAFELKLGNAIAKALADLEMDKILTGE